MNSDNKNNDKTGGKATIGGSMETKTIDQTARPANANSKATEQPIVREGSPQPDLKTPGVPHLHPLNAEMRTRWANFIDADLKDVKTREDLSTAVAMKYGIPADVAATQVKDWAVGRHF